MMSIQQDIDRFTSNVRQRFTSGHCDLSIDELFDQYRIENPSDEHYAENVASIRASIQDYKNGERGTIAGEHSAQLRHDFGVTGK